MTTGHRPTEESTATEVIDSIYHKVAGEPPPSSFTVEALVRFMATQGVARFIVTQKGAFLDDVANEIMKRVNLCCEVLEIPTDRVRNVVDLLQEHLDDEYGTILSHFMDIICLPSVSLSVPVAREQVEVAYAIEALNQLWVHSREHDENLKHPITPLIKAWQYDQNAKHISKEYDRKHPVAIIDRASMGSVRDVIIEGITEELGEMKGISAPPPQSEQIEIPGLETSSILPPVLPLQAVQMVEGIETTKRGAVVMAIRLFFEAIMALEPKETEQEIRFQLGDLLHYLNPGRKYHRTNHLPYVLKGIHSLYFLRIPYRENPDKPSTEVDWIPVFPRTVPNLNSGDDASIRFEVKLPPDATSGMLVEKHILRLTGKQSSPQFNGYLSACSIFDNYGTTPKGIIDPTRSIEIRDPEGNLLKDGRQIFDSRGKPIKDIHHPEAVRQLDREPNPAREQYPIWTFSDLVRACFPKGFDSSKRATYLSRAKKAWEALEAEEFVRIEKDTKGWRIMPSDSHIKRYRAIGKIAK